MFRPMVDALEQRLQASLQQAVQSLQAHFDARLDRLERLIAESRST